MEKKLATNHPSAPATGVLMFGLLISFLFKGEGTSSEVVRFSAILIGVAIVASLLIEIALTEARNLVRLDNAGIVALYFLTLFEFLFPQPFFTKLVTAEQSKVGIDLIILGLVGIGTGRHLVSRKPFTKLSLSAVNMTPRDLFWLAVFAFFLGHLHMWIAVGFNPIEWAKQVMGARFTQDWQRGRLGGLSSLLSELQWMNCLVPAVAAIIWVRRKEVPGYMVLGSSFMLLLVLFGGVSLGARYQFAFYLLSFCGGFFLSLPSIRMRKAIFVAVPLFAGFVALSFVVVNFRNQGMMHTLNALIFDQVDGRTGAREEFINGMKSENGFKFIVDRNIYPISLLPEYFPETYPFLEEEILIHIIVRPVPRALWPGKPESLSVTTEGILGIESATIASTFVGEGYMAYGRTGVILFGLFLGVFAGFWNRIPVGQSNSTMVLLYSCGFVWMAIAVRSIVWLSVGFLPSIALCFYVWFVLPVIRGNSSRLTFLPKGDKVGPG